MSQYLSVLELSSLDGTNGFKIIGEAAGDQFGFSVSSAGDVNNDGFDDFIIGAKLAAPSGAKSGAAYVVFGKASGVPTLATLDGINGFQINGAAVYDYAGQSVSFAGDVNGDGFDDVIIGAFGADPSGLYSGASYVVFGKGSGFASTLELSSLDGNNGFKVNGVAVDDISGMSVSSAGDVNDDGFDDVVIGANGADPHGSFSGSSYVVFGKSSGWGPTFALSGLDGNNGFKINGAQDFDQCGFSVSSAGDVNGDGIDDLIVGARGEPLGASIGASHIIFGKADFDPTLELSALDGNNGFQILGKAVGDRSGFSVSSAGDVNGDGLADLIVGAYGADPNGSYSGASYVVFGKGHFNATFKVGKLDGSNGFKIKGAAEGDRSGWSVSSAGDFNGDGFDDVIVGAKWADPNAVYASGAAYVVFGAASGFAAGLNVASLDGNNGFRIHGETDSDYAGLSVSPAGDVNGDGFADIMVGAPDFGPSSGDPGAGYVIFGGKPGEAVIRTGTDIANTIHGSDFADTLSGLNGDDTLIGNGGADTMLGGAGKDVLTGGTGGDDLTGGAGKDTLDGGSGAEHFIYASAADSTNANYDTIKKCDFTQDKFDTAVAVAAIDATVATGALSKASFDADLAAAVAAGDLAANNAVLFTPDGGTLAGKTFLVVDANGTAGYQAGADLVIELVSAQNIGSLNAGDFI